MRRSRNADPLVGYYFNLVGPRKETMLRIRAQVDFVMVTRNVQSLRQFAGT